MSSKKETRQHLPDWRLRMKKELHAKLSWGFWVTKTQVLFWFKSPCFEYWLKLFLTRWLPQTSPESEVLSWVVRIKRREKFPLGQGSTQRAHQRGNFQVFRSVDFFSLREKICGGYRSGGSLSTPGRPARAVAQLFQGLDFAVVISQRGCGHLNFFIFIFLHPLVHVKKKRGENAGVNEELLRKVSFCFFVSFVCNSHLGFQASAENWKNTFI